MVFNSVAESFREAWLRLQYRRLARHSYFDPARALVISGDPRGGTTWLAETLSFLPGTALLWEPLAISQVEKFKRLGFSWRQYIPENEQWPEARKAFTELFSGKLLSPYLCRSTSPAQIRDAQFLLVKFCRASQLLPWLTREYQFINCPIYLVRHPCAVVASQLRQGGWNRVKPELKSPRGSYKFFYDEHEDFFRTIDTVEKRMAAIWCLCNGIPLNHSENNKRWITITYESLLSDPESQFRRIEQRWNVAFPDSVYQNVTKPSTSTVAGSPVEFGKKTEQLRYWKKHLTDKQIENILGTLEYFNIRLYNYSEYPQIEY